MIWRTGKRPVIAVTTSRHKSTIAWACDWLSVWRAGGKPVRVMPGKTVDIDEVDGLVIGGGDDIGAELWGGEMTMDVRIDPERDVLEQRMLAGALERGLPVLGICRGSQMINIQLGGNLHADIYTTFKDVKRMRTVLPRKSVNIVEGTHLHKLVGGEVCRVNSLHHQAVKDLGDGLSVAACDTDGIVQAIENSEAPFLIGVQWHPEFLFFNRAQQNLFRGLVGAARDRLADIGETPKR